MTPLTCGGLGLRPVPGIGEEYGTGKSELHTRDNCGLLQAVAAKMKTDRTPPLANNYYGQRANRSLPFLHRQS
jgi:hypothetical protein